MNPAIVEYDDTFEELRADLEMEGRDLEWTITDPKYEDCEHQLAVLEQHLHSDIHLTSGRIDPDDANEFLLERIPYCLTQKSTLFHVAFFGQLRHYVTPLNPFDLEQLTVLNYKMSILHLHQKLWKTYLDAGTGRLRPIKLNDTQQTAQQLVHYWPKYLLTTSIARGFARKCLSTDMNHDEHIQNVKDYLDYLENQSKKYMEEFDRVKTDMLHYTKELDYQIETFVRKEVLIPVRLYFESWITLIEHDYDDRQLHSDYLALQPSQEHVRIVFLFDEMSMNLSLFVFLCFGFRRY